MKKKVFIGLLVMVALIVFSLPAAADRKGPPAFGNLYHDGDIVRTVVPPAFMPFEGRDNLYVISGGVDGQLAVAAVAPGDRDYHGGQWAFHSVTWNVAAYELTSEEDVLDAEAAGDVTVARIPEADFKCPIQP